MFAANRPDTVLPLTVEDAGAPADESDASAKPSTPALFAVAGKMDSPGEIILKVVNVGSRPREAKIHLTGSEDAIFTASGMIPTSSDPSDENSFDHPARIAPKPFDIGKVQDHFQHIFPGYSITLPRLRKLQ